MGGTIGFRNGRAGLMIGSGCIGIAGIGIGIGIGIRGGAAGCTLGGAATCTLGGAATGTIGRATLAGRVG